MTDEPETQAPAPDDPSQPALPDGLGARVLRRSLLALARREGVDPGAIVALAEQHGHRCPVCRGAITKPHLYRAEHRILGVLCGRCAKPIERAQSDLIALQRHRRFSARYRESRDRIGRIIALWR